MNKKLTSRLAGFAFVAAAAVVGGHVSPSAAHSSSSGAGEVLVALGTSRPATAAQSAVTPRLPSLSISSTGAATEGAAETSTAVFVVRLSTPSRKVVQVRFATRQFVSGATQGLDYRVARGTLRFKPLQRTKRVVVAILDDTVAEPEEMFSVALSQPRNARLSPSKSQATGRIAANDLPPAFTIAAELKADDGPGTGRATVTLDAAVGTAAFTLSISDWPYDPAEVHIHSLTTAFGGAYPSLVPLPARNGTVAGSVTVGTTRILQIAVNVPDFYIEVHGRIGQTLPTDLVGGFTRVAGP